MSAHFLCGGFNLLVALFQGVATDPSVHPWSTVIIVFSMIAKGLIAGAYSVIYLFTAEQFPTVIRNSGLGRAYVI